MGYTIIKKAVVFGALIGVIGFTSSYAQQSQVKTITSKLADTSGHPIANVLVSAVNAETEVYTDSEGNFSLEVSTDRDRLIIDEVGYKKKVVQIGTSSAAEIIVLEEDSQFDGNLVIGFPYNSYAKNRSVSAVNVISGEELVSYPTANLLEALAGKIPGLVVRDFSSIPGEESAGLSIRGVGVSTYIDGIQRDATDLSAHEVESVQVIKDLSGRAALGVSGAGPVIWITTKKGRGENGMNVFTQLGLNTPTVLPEYLGSYDYARLHNEALVNDGQSPIYDQAALDAYRNGSDPLNYPNIDYYDEYVRDYSTYRNLNFNFTGGRDGVNYFSMFDYTGNSGLEKVGDQITSDRFRLRGNVNFPINDWIGMSINLSGSYNKRKYPNLGSGAATYDMFQQVLSHYPSNAHAITYEGNYIVSDDYPVNLHNEFLFGGYGETDIINSQNDANLFLDLNQYVNGLTFQGTVSFNILNYIGIGKGGTQALYRVDGSDLERVVEREVDPSLGLGNDYQITRTVGFAQLNYERSFGKHALNLDGALFRGVASTGEFQPEKFLNMVFRANYAFDDRYVVQLDVVPSGSMRLPEGKRFEVYPTAGVAWIASNESFLQDNSLLSYLKFHASAGKMGINNYTVPGYNPYYLNVTEWNNLGSIAFGVTGTQSFIPITVIERVANENISLPERQYFNAGVQSSWAGDRLSLELNYFNEKNAGLFSPRQNVTTALLGGGNFLPLQNYEENLRWGLDGMIQYSDNIGDFSYSLGANALYMRGKNLVVDEAPALPEYRKRAGKDMDLLWLYEADGLFQDQDEIDSHGVSQSWGSVQPGDIRYVDYNKDGVVDEKDVHTTGAHSPRLFYGINFSVGYKGLNLFVQGMGVADGQTLLSSSRYFRITGTQQNYSSLMLDRWTTENTDAEFPRMTVSSQNNLQNSTFWLRDASFFSIKNIQLSYTLPSGFTQNKLSSDWTIFVRSKNLFTTSGLSDYNIDPLNPSAGISSYPLFRTVTVGVSGSF